MSSKLQFSRKITPKQILYVSSGIYWSSTFVFLLIDYSREKLFHIPWNPRVDPSSSSIFGIPLALIHLSACAILASYVIKSYSSDNKIKSLLRSILIVILLVLINFFLFTIIALFYQFHFMGRPE